LKAMQPSVTPGLPDIYPSRCESRPRILARQDPVVHGVGHPPPVTLEKIAAYERDGFMFLPSMFSADEVQTLADETARLLRDGVQSASGNWIQEKHSEEKRSLFAAHTLEPVFSSLAADSRIVDIAEFILGGRVYVHQSRINFKPRFKGREFYWHSDFETWHIEDGMPRMRALSVSISLTESNVHNGPLMLIPGSHKHYVACVGETPDEHYKESLQKQDYGVPDPESLLFLSKGNGLAAPTGPAGSVVIFDCNTMHGSNSNISPYPRASAFLVYNSMENRLRPPFCGKAPRPEFIASRRRAEAVRSSAVDYSKIGRGQ